MPVIAFAYPDGYVQDRIVEHWQMAEDFVEVFQAEYLGGEPAEAIIAINEGRLAIAVSSAYQDIERYKVYHQDDPSTERLDCVKRCAYLVKWFVKLKPLFVKLPEDGLTSDSPLPPLEMVNEFLSIYFFEQHLSVEQNCLVQLDHIKTAEVAYDLLYRQLNEDALIALFQIIKDCVEFGSIEHTPFLEEVLVLG